MKLITDVDESLVVYMTTTSHNYDLGPYILNKTGRRVKTNTIALVSELAGKKEPHKRAEELETH